jgi:hypothetical protein
MEILHGHCRAAWPHEPQNQRKMSVWWPHERRESVSESWCLWKGLEETLLRRFVSISRATTITNHKIILLDRGVFLAWKPRKRCFSWVSAEDACLCPLVSLTSPYSMNECLVPLWMKESGLESQYWWRGLGEMSLLRFGPIFRATTVYNHYHITR